jgi:outer membrane protein assembly factor BamB
MKFKSSICVYLFLLSAALTFTPQSVLAQTKEMGWNVFRGNAQSTGVAQTELPDDLEILWEYKVPKGAFEGTPLIVEEPKTEKGVARTVYVADLDGSLIAIDLDSGEEKWKTKLCISIAASPAYQDGLAFVGDIDGFFHCLDNQGNVKWKFETDGEISSSPNFYKGNVLFGSQDSHLYLLDKEGKELMKHQSQDQIRCSATIAGDRAFVAGCDGFFHIVNLKDGTEIGNVDIQSPTQSTPAVLGDHCFFGTEQAEFCGVDWKKIKAEWSFSDDAGQTSVRGCAAVTPKHVVFGARNRQVYSLDPITGKKNWSTTLKSKIDSSPIIVGDKVYAGSMDGRFYALSLESGKVLWEKQFNGGFLSSPAAAFGRLVIATDRGVVYCLGKKQN